MSGATEPDWLNFDVHGVLGVRIHPDAPATQALRTLMEAFAVGRAVPGDIVLAPGLDPMIDAAVVGDDLAYNATSIHFRRHHVQVVVDGTEFRVNGPGDVFSALMPLLDVAMVIRETAMVHTASLGYRGCAIALPGPAGAETAEVATGLSGRPGFSLMGGEWGFVTADGRLLGHDKPVVAERPDRRSPRRTLSGAALRAQALPGLRGPVRRLTTALAPHLGNHPTWGDVPLRRPADDRTVPPRPDETGTLDAPLLMAVFVERYEGARSHVAERDTAWMVQRLVGNCSLAMPTVSRSVLEGMAATSHLSLGCFFEEKAAVLVRALAEVPLFVLQVPSVYSSSVVSEEVVRVVEDLLRSLVDAGKAPSGVSVA